MRALLTIVLKLLNYLYVCGNLPYCLLTLEFHLTNIRRLTNEQTQIESGEWNQDR